MATIREYFEEASPAAAADITFQLTNQAGTEFPLILRLQPDFAASASHFRLFIPESGVVTDLALHMFGTDMLQQGRMPDGMSVEIISGFTDYDDLVTSEEFVYTRRVKVFIDEHLTAEERKDIVSIGR